MNRINTQTSVSLVVRRSPRQRAGFNFVELLFAVMLLGIGFIMIAAIFPVVIQQTSATLDDSVAQSVQVNGRNAIAAVANVTNLPATGTPAVVMPLPVGAPPADVGLHTRGSQICSADPRYAWIALYRADNLTPTTVELFMFAVKSRDGNPFEAVDLCDPDAGNPPQQNLWPRFVEVEVIPGIAGEAGLISFIVSATNEEEAVAEGTFVVIADDNITAPALDSGRMNGKIYQVGVRRTDLDVVNRQVWELVPGWGFVADPGADGLMPAPDDADNITAVGINCTAPSTVTVSGPATAWIVGKSLADPAAAQSPAVYDGPSMDISIQKFSITIP